jgi:hypothetical protein
MSSASILKHYPSINTTWRHTLLFAGQYFYAGYWGRDKLVGNTLGNIYCIYLTCDDTTQQMLVTQRHTTEITNIRVCASMYLQALKHLSS